MERPQQGLQREVLVGTSIRRFRARGARCSQLVALGTPDLQVLRFGWIRQVIASLFFCRMRFIREEHHLSRWYEGKLPAQRPAHFGSLKGHALMWQRPRRLRELMCLRRATSKRWRRLRNVTTIISGWDCFPTRPGLIARGDGRSTF